MDGTRGPRRPHRSFRERGRCARRPCRQIVVAGTPGRSRNAAPLEPRCGRRRSGLQRHWPCQGVGGEHVREYRRGAGVARLGGPAERRTPANRRHGAGPGSPGGRRRGAARGHRLGRGPALRSAGGDGPGWPLWLRPPARLALRRLGHQPRTQTGGRPHPAGQSDAASRSRRLDPRALRLLGPRVGCGHRSVRARRAGSPRATYGRRVQRTSGRDGCQRQIRGLRGARTGPASGGRRRIRGCVRGHHRRRPGDADRHSVEHGGGCARHHRDAGGCAHPPRSTQPRARRTRAQNQPTPRRPSAPSRTTGAISRRAGWHRDGTG